MIIRRAGQTLRLPSTSSLASPTRSIYSTSTRSRTNTKVHAASQRIPFENGNAWSNTVGNTAIALASLLAATCLLNTNTHELKLEAKQNKESGAASTKYKKDDVSLLCLIGYPQSGKTTQVENLENKWGKDGWKAIKNVDSMEKLEKAIEEARKNDKGKQSSLLIDGFPRNWQEAQDVEKKLCEIFAFAYFHMDEDEWTKRTGKSKDDYKKIENNLKSLRENPREKGNILEIVAGWPKDEVWEMVEAKIEQIIELREMGEL
ncbi:uncharacterized protein FA14DRAFT_160117 [Meira miltonrushii]|uniref:P-loop containing nucleoside triphosphate hydrolase protein n=1 Tax=Meira miltonrushii TaxID=1280837 RepID=A0A316VAP7_9BASI|nr:uncharacterized protein FA14DRAFT_160117 [Meira miltonrushii]PWN34572.1 hypothetical protein FA14DRAFT_160117 [Meira miltonrushii]